MSNSRKKAGSQSYQQLCLAKHYSTYIT